MSAPETTQAKSIDKFALAAAAIAAVMMVAYISLISSQDKTPAVWVVAMLVLGAACAGYGAFGGRGSLTALWMATTALALVGLTEILTIGLPILIAAALCAVGAVRALPRLPPGP